MHGRKKVHQSEAEKSVQQEKAKTYSTLVKIIMARKAENNTSSETLTLTEKMLTSNPDFYTLWNMRRKILISSHFESLGLSNDKPIIKISPDSGEAIYTQELTVSANALRKNPKSYGAWYHRVWMFDRFEIDPQSELGLCSLLLKEDQRNFHCWNYRRHIVSSGKCSHSDEFKFSTEKIVENFSNYSAFHHRSIYIMAMLDQNCKECLAQEFSIVENAIFTEPDDQSAWWYYQFLISQATRRLFKQAALSQPFTKAHSDDIKCYLKIIRSHIELMNSLLDLENKSKWAMVCLASLYQYLIEAAAGLSEVYTVAAISSSESGSDYDGLDYQLPSSEEVAEAKATRTGLLKELATIDSAHSRRYVYLLQQ